MKLHERYRQVEAAHCDLEKFLIDLVKSYDLTYAEQFEIMTRCLNRSAQYCVKDERNPEPEEEPELAIAKELVEKTITPVVRTGMDCPKFLGVADGTKCCVCGRHSISFHYYNGNRDQLACTECATRKTPRKRMDGLPPDPKRECPQCGAINASPGFMCCGYGRG